MKLTGILILLICSALTGDLFAAYFKGKYELLAVTSRFLLECELIMDYKAPAVPDMLNDIMSSGIKLPYFIEKCKTDSGAEDVIKVLSADNCFDRNDRERLCEFFACIGNKKKKGEIKKISSVRSYFDIRVQEERAVTERKVHLFHILGVLGGVFIAVMLV